MLNAKNWVRHFGYSSQIFHRDKNSEICLVFRPQSTLTRCGFEREQRTRAGSGKKKHLSSFCVPSILRGQVLRSSYRSLGESCEPVTQQWVQKFPDIHITKFCKSCRHAVLGLGPYLYSRHSGMVFRRKEVAVWFGAEQRSVGMAYCPAPSHFQPWSNIHRVQKKRDQNVFCNISYRTRAIVMKFGTQFPE